MHLMHRKLNGEWERLLQQQYPHKHICCYIRLLWQNVQVWLLLKEDFVYWIRLVDNFHGVCLLFESQLVDNVGDT